MSKNITRKRPLIVFALVFFIFLVSFMLLPQRNYILSNATKAINTLKFALFYNPKQFDELDKEMRNWLKQQRFSLKNGWFHVDWNTVELATINSNSSSTTDNIGLNIAELLNTAFMQDAPLSDQTPGFINRGVFVHGLDEFDENGNIFTPKMLTTATSYVQKDLSYKNKYPIWNDTFHVYELGLGSPGIIYFPATNQNSSPDVYSVFALFPIDAMSNQRFMQVNTVDYEIEDGFHDYREVVIQAWEEHKSVNLAKLEGMTDFISYMRGDPNRRFAPLPLSADKEGYETFFTYGRELIKHKNFKWNEAILRLPEDNFPNQVAAIFYLSAKKHRYYRAPSGKIKKYNVHLMEAQKLQLELFETSGIFKPIIEINIDFLINRQAPFFYHSEDQVVLL